MTKQIKADLEQVVEAILNAIYKPQRIETTIIDDIRTAIEQFVEEDKAQMDSIDKIISEMEKTIVQYIVMNMEDVADDFKYYLTRLKALRDMSNNPRTER